MRERRCENGVGNGAHRCSVFVLVVPNGKRRFHATFDYRVNGESRAHEDTVSDTAPYTSDLFPVSYSAACAHARYRYASCERIYSVGWNEHPFTGSFCYFRRVSYSALACQSCLATT